MNGATSSASTPITPASCVSAAAMCGVFLDLATAGGVAKTLMRLMPAAGASPEPLVADLRDLLRQLA